MQAAAPPRAKAAQPPALAKLPKADSTSSGEARRRVRPPVPPPSAKQIKEMWEEVTNDILLRDQKMLTRLVKTRPEVIRVVLEKPENERVAFLKKIIATCYQVETVLSHLKNLTVRQRGKIVLIHKRLPEQKVVKFVNQILDATNAKQRNAVLSEYMQKEEEVGIDKKPVKKRVPARNPFLDEDVDEVRGSKSRSSASGSKTSSEENSSDRKFIKNGVVKNPDALQYGLRLNKKGAKEIQESSDIIAALLGQRDVPEAQHKQKEKLRRKIDLQLVELSKTDRTLGMQIHTLLLQHESLSIETLHEIATILASKKTPTLNEILENIKSDSSYSSGTF